MALSQIARRGMYSLGIFMLFWCAYNVSWYVSIIIRCVEVHLKGIVYAGYSIKYYVTESIIIHSEEIFYSIIRTFMYTNSTFKSYTA